MKKYDLKKIEQKLLSNVIPKSMAGFDINAFAYKYAQNKEVQIIRPQEVREIFQSKILLSC